MTEAIEVVATLGEYEAPFDVRDTIRRLLSTVPEKYLAGLRRVIITTSGGLSGKFRRTVFRYRSGARVNYGGAGGYYEQKWRGREAQIVILIDNILRGWPRWLFRFHLFRDMVVDHALYHELGHHLHATQRPSRKDPEVVAEEAAHWLHRNHLYRRYRYLRPFWGVVQFVWRRARPGA